MQDIYIVEAARSPIGKRGKGLAGLLPADLLGKVQRGALERAGIDPANVGQIIGGCVSQINQHPSISRASLGCLRVFLKRWRQPRWILSAVPASRQPLLGQQ